MGQTKQFLTATRIVIFYINLLLEHDSLLRLEFLLCVLVSRSMNKIIVDIKHAEY